MNRRKAKISRRGFLKGAAAAATFTIVPRHVLGGPGRVAPSDTFGGALVGCGGRGPGTFGSLKGHGLTVQMLAACDVNDQRSARTAQRTKGKQTAECKTYLPPPPQRENPLCPIIVGQRGPRQVSF